MGRKLRISVISSLDIIEKRLSSFLEHLLILHCSTNPHATGTSHGSVAPIEYLGYKLPVARLLAGLSHMGLVVLHNPSGYTLRIMQYYFAHIRERPLVGMLLLLYIDPKEVGHDVNDVMQLP